MKQFCLLCLCASIAVFSACKKDKNPSITGAWDLRSELGKSSINDVIQDSSSDYFDAGEAVVTFNEDRSYTQVFTSSPSRNHNGSYQLDGNRIILTAIDSVSSSSDTATYSVSADNLQFIFTEETVVGGTVYKREDVFRFTRH